MAELKEGLRRRRGDGEGLITGRRGEMLAGCGELLVMMGRRGSCNNDGNTSIQSSPMPTAHGGDEGGRSQCVHVADDSWGMTSGGLADGSTDGEPIGTSDNAGTGDPANVMKTTIKHGAREPEG